ncbi:unnamed protein product [Alternaria alternata]
MRFSAIVPATLFALASAAPVEEVKRAASSLQGESAGFRTINSRVRAAVSGGKTYNTVYTADFSQNSAAGTRDIVNKITTTLASSPKECFILEGYSQGAQATVNAMSTHKSGLACNVDNNGGTTTKNVNGLSAALGGGIPSNWVAKTLDVCIFGDGVCDTTHGAGINAQHLQYPNDAPTQKLGTDYITKALGA